MQVQTGLILLTDGEKITGLVPDGSDLSGYTEVDLAGNGKP